MTNPLLPDLGQRTYVMAILNLTLDSFSGDGLLQKAHPLEETLAQARRFVAEGADILALGAESTRPGARPVSAEMELEALLPVLPLLRQELPNVVISVDTYKASVAEACLQAGAQIINDVWAFQKDEEMAAVVAKHGATVVLMHNRSAHQTEATALGGRYVDVHYDNIVAEVSAGLSDAVHLAQIAGIADERILVDPGIGFGKTTAQNLQLLKHLARLRELGHPILLGISRKSFIGYTLDLPVDQRLEGSLAANAWGILHGADVVRVHDVLATVRLARMLDAIRAA